MTTAITGMSFWIRPLINRGPITEPVACVPYKSLIHTRSLMNCYMFPYRPDYIFNKGLFKRSIQHSGLSLSISSMVILLIFLFILRLRYFNTLYIPTIT